MRVKYLAHLVDLVKIVGAKHTAQSFPQSRQNSLARHALAPNHSLQGESSLDSPHNRLNAANHRPKTAHKDRNTHKIALAGQIPKQIWQI